MAVEFQPGIIVESANRLYKQADGLVFAWACRLGLVGLFFGGGIAVAAHLNPLFGAVGAALVAAVMGAMYGRDQGFALRLQAQQAMCQLQIEINTRPR